MKEITNFINSLIKNKYKPQLSSELVSILRKLESENIFTSKDESSQSKKKIRNSFSLQKITTNLIKKYFPGENLSSFDLIQKLQDKGLSELAIDFSRILEEVLSSVSIKTQSSIKEGVFKVTLSNGLLAIYKPTIRGSTITQDELNNIHVREVVSYRVSREIGNHQVPVTVYRADLNGTLQLFCESDDEMIRLIQKGRIDRPIELTALDFILKEMDRNEGNYLITSEGNIVAIDHDRALTDSKKPIDTKIRDLAFRY